MNQSSVQKPVVQAEEYLTACQEYTHPYERRRLLEDWAGKPAATQSVVADFKKRAGDLSGKSLLDIGFGNGLYASAFVQAGAHVSGLEVNPILLKIAQESLQGTGTSADLRLYDGSAFPFPDAVFDYAFSVSVFEHVSNQKKFLTEVARILKPQGKFYLAFPNRWRPREPHTGVLFLSYLPVSVAQWLLRTISRRNTIQELNLSFQSYGSLVYLLRGTDLEVIFEDVGSRYSRQILKKILARMGVHHSVFLGTIMVVLKKKS